MIILMVVVVGIFSFINLPQALMPDFQLPFAIVMTNLPNASPEDVENLVTVPLESVLAAADNLYRFQSMSMEGQSVVMLEFHMGTDLDFATLDIRERVAMVSGVLPSDATEPMVLKLDMNAGPVMNIQISGDMSLSQLYNTVQNTFLTNFERAPGVANINVTGGLTEEISVALNPETLAGFGLSVSQIQQMLAAENINLPSGEVTRGSTEVIVRTVGEFGSVDDIRNFPIPLMDRSVVRLQDIASITQGYRERTTLNRMNGETSVGLSITAQSDANVVDVSNAIHRVISNLETQFPEFTFRISFDEAEFIQQSLSSLSRAAIVGGILAIFIIFLFLRNFRTTLVIAISVPVSLLVTFAVMEFQGMTLNLITLSALALAIGILIDNSIIVLENIFRTRQFVEDPHEAAKQGASEVFIAVLAATLTSLAVFVPLAMASGLGGLLFYDFSFTLVIALAASLIVSLTAVPMLCSKLLSKGVSTNYVRFGRRRYKFKLIHKFTEFIDFLTRKYDSIMRVALRKRKRVIISCILAFVMSLSLIGFIGTELFPEADEGNFSIGINMPFGTPLHEIDVLMTEIEQYVLLIPEVRHASVRVGGGGGFFGDGNSGNMNVSLVSLSERNRSTEDVARQIRERFRYTAGAEITVAGAATFGDMVGGGIDMSIVLMGTDFRTLEAIGNDLISVIAEIPEVEEAVLDVEEGNPEVRVIIDRNIAAHYGVSAFQLANSLSSSLSGVTATQLRVAGEETNVVLSLPDTFAESIDNMRQIMVTGSAGIPVPVGQISTLEFDNSPGTIYRFNQQRSIVLNVNIDSDNLAATAMQIITLVENYNFPDGYFHQAFGMQEELFNAFGGLIQAFIIAIALVYLVLAAQFESLVLPFIVTTSIPFAMSGAFVALFVTGTAFSMTSLLGLVMLVGIVINNSILLVTFISKYRDTMDRNESLIEAGKVRMRPILMTALTTCAAMIPISLGIGEGAEMMAPMGISIIGGLIASTVVTLVFVPVLYSVIDDNKQKRMAKKALKNERIAALEAKWREEDARLEEAKNAK